MSHGANKLHMPYLTISIYCSCPISGKSINCIENPINSWRHWNLCPNSFFEWNWSFHTSMFTSLSSGEEATEEQTVFILQKTALDHFGAKNCIWGLIYKKNCIQSLIYCSGPGHRIGTLLYPCVGQNAPKSMRIKGTCQGVICTCQNFLVH